MKKNAFLPRVDPPFLILVAAAFAGNYFTLPLFFGAHYIFGSIAVMAALRLYGTANGVAAAMISGSYTWYLWNHPYGLITFVLEAFFVGLLLRRKPENESVVFWDALFWFAVGVPFIAVFYSSMLGFNSQSILLIMLKQSVNGIFNAVIASLLIEYLPLARWARSAAPQPSSSLQHKLFNVMMLLVIVPVFATMLIDSRRELRRIEQTIRRELETVSLRTVETFSDWINGHLTAVHDVAAAAEQEGLNPAPLQQRLEQVKRLFPDFHNICVADASATTIAFSPLYNEKGERTVGMNFSDRPYYREMKRTLRPFISEVFLGRGGVFTPIVTISVPVQKNRQFQGYVLGAVNLSHISDRLRRPSTPQQLNVTLLDRADTVIASTRNDLQPMDRFDLRKGLQLSALGPSVYLWAAPDAHLASMERWRRSSYVMKTLFKGEIPWTLIVESPVAPFSYTLYQSYITSFTVILFVLLGALVISVSLSSSLVNPLWRLSEVTRDLPARIAGQGEIAWPASPVVEIGSLVENFRAMVSALNRQFQELEDTNHALLDSEQRYRTLFEESRDVVFISTPGGRFLDINPAGVELFGYSSKEEVLALDIGKDLYQHAGDRERIMREYAEHGFVKDFETTIKKKNGEPVTVLITASAVYDAQGNSASYRGIMRDVTQLKRLEQQLLQAQKMEAVGQLAGGVAHDFNNILTAIIGYGNLLKMQMRPDEPYGPYVDHVLAAAERAANLTHGLLAFSRKQIINPRPVDINEVVAGVEKLLRRLIGEDIELRTVPAEGAVPVMADPGQLEQVLMNLATNARDAMPEGGVLSIETDVRVLDDRFVADHQEAKPGKYAVISVSDTGMGIDRALQSRIFEPFFTTKEVGKGTGLGLSIVYGIIAQHEGFIELDSRPGNGTRFILYLPVLEEPVTGAAQRVHAEVQGGSETILVAEDEPLVRELILDVLTRFGYRTLAAENGEDAAAKFREHADSVDLLLLDVIMPKRNGFEVYREMNGLKPGIKTLFLSGYTADIIESKGLVEKGFTVIDKPISIHNLLRTIREVLDA